MIKERKHGLTAKQRKELLWLYVWMDAVILAVIAAVGWGLSKLLHWILG
jgi:hypothetical protein